VSDSSSVQSGSANNNGAQGAPPPMFYKQPEPLMPGAHKDFKIRAELDFSFAATSNSVPLTMPEFSYVARHYPIIFLGPELIPTMVVGVATGSNLFVDSKGEWDRDTYVPAFVRRYPFILMNTPGDEKAVHLGIDAAGRSTKPNARALFENEVETETLKTNIDFCQQFHGAYQMTREFTEALVKANICIESGVDIQNKDGSSALQLGPFMVVAEEKFRAMPEATVVEWHRTGFLHAVHFHLQSQTNWQSLIQRSERQLAAA